MSADDAEDHDAVEEFGGGINSNSLWWRLWRWVGYALARWLPQAAGALSIGIADRILDEDELVSVPYDDNAEELGSGDIEVLTPTETVSRTSLKTVKKDLLN